MKSLILFTISSLFLFNNKALSIAPPTPKLNIPNATVNPQSANNGSPGTFAVKPTTAMISQVFGPDPNDTERLPFGELAAATTTPLGIALQSRDLTKHPEACCFPFADGQVTQSNDKIGANTFKNSIGQLNNQSGDQAQ